MKRRPRSRARSATAAEHCSRPAIRRSGRRTNCWWSRSMDRSARRWSGRGRNRHGRRNRVRSSHRPAGCAEPSAGCRRRAPDRPATARQAPAPRGRASWLCSRSAVVTHPRGPLPRSAASGSARPCDHRTNPWKSPETTDSAGSSHNRTEGVPFATIIATNSQLQERLWEAAVEWHWPSDGRATSRRRHRRHCEPRVRERASSHGPRIREAIFGARARDASGFRVRAQVRALPNDGRSQKS